MNIGKFTALLSAVLLSTTTHAYQFEAGVSDIEGTTEFDNIGAGTDIEYDSSSTAFFGTFHFNDVDTSTGPWAEAAFLNKSSSISVVSSDYSNKRSDNDDKYSSDLKGLGVRGVFGSYFTLEAFITEAKGKDNDNWKYDESVKSIGAGSYIGKRHQIMGRYTRTESTEKAVNSLGVDEVETDVSVNYKSVLNLGSRQHLSVIGSVAIFSVDDDEDTVGSEVEFGVVYYPIKNLGIAVASGARIADDDDIGEVTTSTLTLGVSYFPIESIGLKVVYTTGETEYDNDNPSITYLDSESTALELGIQFRI